LYTNCREKSSKRAYSPDIFQRICELSPAFPAQSGGRRTAKPLRTAENVRRRRAYPQVRTPAPKEMDAITECKNKLRIHTRALPLTAERLPVYLRAQPTVCARRQPANAAARGVTADNAYLRTTLRYCLLSHARRPSRRLVRRSHAPRTISVCAPSLRMQSSVRS